MSQMDKLIARIKEWTDHHPLEVMHLTVIWDRAGQPVCWWFDDGKVEGLMKT